MKKVLCYIVAVITAMSTMMTMQSCNDGETYADKKNREKNAIRKFLDDNEFVGKIKVINEAQFKAQGSTTNVAENEFVLFEDNGVYMQIVQRGEGKTLDEMSGETTDGTISKTILCRFLEYDIEDADTTYTNYYSSTIVDKMVCTYNKRARSYTASYTEGYMMAYYKTATVPQGWLKPLDYIGLTRSSGKIAKVRLIVPHSSGTSNASNYVLPFYYEISYQLGL